MDATSLPVPNLKTAFEEFLDEAYKGHPLPPQHLLEMKRLFIGGAWAALSRLPMVNLSHGQQPADTMRNQCQVFFENTRAIPLAPPPAAVIVETVPAEAESPAAETAAAPTASS